MTATLALALGALLAVACVVAVALPFLRDPEPRDDRLDEPDALERRRLELVEERDRALADLKELEFDHRTGKVSDEDYRALVGPLRKRAAGALRALEPAAQPPGGVAARPRCGMHRGPGEGVGGNREVPPGNQEGEGNRKVPPRVARG